MGGAGAIPVAPALEVRLVEWGLGRARRARPGPPPGVSMALAVRASAATTFVLAPASRECVPAAAAAEVVVATLAAQFVGAAPAADEVVALKPGHRVVAPAGGDHVGVLRPAQPVRPARARDRRVAAGAGGGQRVDCQLLEKSAAREPDEALVDLGAVEVRAPDRAVVVSVHDRVGRPVDVRGVHGDAGGVLCADDERLLVCGAVEARAPDRARAQVRPVDVGRVEGDRVVRAGAVAVQQKARVDVRAVEVRAPDRGGARSVDVDRVRPVDVRCVDRHRLDADARGDEVLVDAGAVEVGPSDRALRKARPVDVPLVRS